MGFPVCLHEAGDGNTPFFNAATRFSQWIDGFSPLPTEMVFERESPSRHSSDEFASVMNRAAGPIRARRFRRKALACLSTVIEAYHRGHRVTFLADASASHAVETKTTAQPCTASSPKCWACSAHREPGRVDRCDQSMAPRRRSRARPAKPRGRLMPRQASADALCLFSAGGATPKIKRVAEPSAVPRADVPHGRAGSETTTR